VGGVIIPIELTKALDIVSILEVNDHNQLIVISHSHAQSREEIIGFTIEVQAF